MEARSIETNTVPHDKNVDPSKFEAAGVAHAKANALKPIEDEPKERMPTVHEFFTDEAYRNLPVDPDVLVVRIPLNKPRGVSKPNKDGKGGGVRYITVPQKNSFRGGDVLPFPGQPKNLVVAVSVWEQRD